MATSITNEEALGKLQDGEVVLSVKGVSKKFCRDLKRSLLYGVQDIASELLGTRLKSERLRLKEFWALNDVSFELRRGEALGLVGPNGSGKTTLLRIISGLIKPDTGSVEVEGRVAPLIALGAGFNPILTGRENIYANMSILGLSKKEIDERFQDVVDFAEIGDAIDAPVQSYSSGMAARLGFACAIYTEPDILLIDEVLAVGDIRFRAKCTRRLYELRQKGVAFVLVNHNPQAILSVCTSGVYLSKGNLIASGDTDLIIRQYEEDLFMDKTVKSTGALFIAEKSEDETSGLDIIYICIKNSEGNIIKSPLTGEPTCLCIGCKAHQAIDNVIVNITVNELTGENDSVLFISGLLDNRTFDLPIGKHEIQVQLPYLGLRPGSYNTKVFMRKDVLFTLDAIESFSFTVKAETNMTRCLFYQPRVWKLVKNQILKKQEFTDTSDCITEAGYQIGKD